MSEHADAGSLADRLEGIVVSRAAADYKLQRREAATLREAASVLRALAGTRETAQAYPPDDVYVPKATVTWGDVRAAQAAPSEPEEADPQSPTFGHGRGDKSAAQSVSGSLGAAALPPDAHADAELVEQVLCDGLDYWGHELDDVSVRVVAVAPRAKRYESALAALARLVAALPDAPAETHTEPKEVPS